MTILIEKICKTRSKAKLSNTAYKYDFSAQILTYME